MLFMDKEKIDVVRAFYSWLLLLLLFHEMAKCLKSKTTIENKMKKMRGREKEGEMTSQVHKCELKPNDDVDQKACISFFFKI